MKSSRASWTRKGREVGGQASSSCPIPFFPLLVYACHSPEPRPAEGATSRERRDMGVPRDETRLTRGICASSHANARLTRSVRLSSSIVLRSGTQIQTHAQTRVKSLPA